MRKLPRSAAVKLKARSPRNSGQTPETEWKRDSNWRRRTWRDGRRDGSSPSAIILDIAKEKRFNASMTTTALQQCSAAIDMGLSGEDDAAVGKVIAKELDIVL